MPIFRRPNLLTAIVLLTACSATSVAQGNTEREPVYVIAHMTNTPAAVDWALEEGANGVEIDLRFNATHVPEVFHHRGVCDCICAPGKESVCRILGSESDGGHSNPCESRTGSANLLQHLATKSQLALVVIDSKIEGMTIAAQETAGRSVIRALDENLFRSDKGYLGKVIVGTAKSQGTPYLKAAAGAANKSPNAKRIFFSFDQEAGRATETIERLVGLPTKARAYGTGTTACSLGPFGSAIEHGYRNKRVGVVSLVYIWTLDRKRSMERYLEKGARGIITNYPRRAHDIVSRMGFELALPDTDLPWAKSDQVAR